MSYHCRRRGREAAGEELYRIDCRQRVCHDGDPVGIRSAFARRASHKARPFAVIPLHESKIRLFSGIETVCPEQLFDLLKYRFL